MEEGPRRAQRRLEVQRLRSRDEPVATVVVSAVAGLPADRLGVARLRRRREHLRGRLDEVAESEHAAPQRNRRAAGAALSSTVACAASAESWPTATRSSATRRSSGAWPT